jgi:hypothetical protein
MRTVEPDGSLRLVSMREQVHRLRGLYRDLAPDTSLADELVEVRLIRD